MLLDVICLFYDLFYHVFVLFLLIMLLVFLTFKIYNVLLFHRYFLLVIYGRLYFPLLLLMLMLFTIQI